MRIHVIGHTDDSKPFNSPFHDNWELSAARAISVVKILIKNHVEPKLLTACGKAEYEPIASNLTETGKEKNRRVELYFFSKDEDEKESAKKSILDAAAGG
jgi:chemotaxis protein MotB